MQIPAVVHHKIMLLRKIEKKKKRVSGFTLVELILYVALVAIFVTGAVYFAWDIIYGREKAFQQQIVNQSARIAMERIAYEIRRAVDITSVSASQAILDNDGTATTITLSGETIFITSSGAGPYELSSNQVRVTNLVFTNYTNPTDDSKNIKVEMTVEQAQSTASGQLTAVTSLEDSIELNSQFNQSRRLLVNLSGVNLVATTSLEGMTIQDTGVDDLVIDQLQIDWTGTVGGENITEIQIGGGSIEWTGVQSAGSTIDLVDYVLAQADGVVDIDYLLFDSDMSGAFLNIDYILSDGSYNKTEVEITTGGTPTPIPTSTPTPTPGFANCNDYCAGNGYSVGTCRKNARTCNQNGETHESAGDQYCTGGPNADTCCCAP